MQYIATDIEGAFARHSAGVERAASAVAALDDEEKRDLQAFAGGCEDFESKQEIETHYRLMKDRQRPLGHEAVAAMRAEYDGLLSGAFKLDAERVREMGAALSLDNLTDDDLRGLAADNRHDYSALKAIADYGHGSRFARDLGRALGAFVEQVGEAPGKITRFCASGVDGDVRWRSKVESRCRLVAESYDDIQALIDGRTVERVTDPLLRALSMAG